MPNNLKEPDELHFYSSDALKTRATKIWQMIGIGMSASLRELVIYRIHDVLTIYKELDEEYAKKQQEKGLT